MATLYDAPPEELVDELAGRLADEFDEPDWVEFVKTGENKELPPEQEDFWHRRAASLLRKVAVDGPVGVERLSTEYGGSKEGTGRWRVASNRRTDGSKKIIRVALQQLEEEDYVETADGEGRRITSEGRSLLDDTAGDVLEELDRPELDRYA
jgi:small subunit ribosomal protein S19e